VPFALLSGQSQFMPAHVHQRYMRLYIDNGGMRRADPSDIPLLVGLMREFCAEASYRLHDTRAAEAFAAILADEHLGYVCIIQSEQEEVGYIVLTVKYAMEYGGLIACLDDLYVTPDWRNKGLAFAALFEIRSFCGPAGICAITVEAGYDNGPAQTVYRRVGFAEAAGRQLLALPVTSPMHLLE
jgi:GNAT superfamily N-acetyltransferase